MERESLVNEILENNLKKEVSKVHYKPSVNFLPYNFDLDEWLGNQTLYGFKKFNKDYCADIVSSIYMAPVKNKALREDGEKGKRPFYNLNSKIMYSRNKEYPKYIKLLIEGGVIETDGIYEVGKKSRGYRLTSTYYDEPCKTYLNYRFGRHVVKNEMDIALIEQNAGYNKTVKSLIGNLNHFKLNYDESIKKLEYEYANGAMGVYKRNTIYCSLVKLKNGEFFALQDDYGRVHTNFTNLKKEYRNYLTADEENLVSLDLKNAQPFFSTLLTKASFWESTVANQISFKSLKENITRNIKNINSIIMFTKLVEDNVDVLSYNNFVLSGEFYEYFSFALIDAGLSCNSRDDAKTTIFEIFFSKTSSLKRNKSAQVFKALFPTIYELFRLIKECGHNLLALILQCIESKIIIDRVADDFMIKNPDAPIFTIHDSIVIPERCFEPELINMRNLIVSCTGCEPKISTEFYTLGSLN